MCSRRDGENLLGYWFRQFREEPLPVLSFGTLVAVVFLWNDAKHEAELHREYMREQNALQVECIKEQTAAFSEVSAKLQLINSRLEHLEREHEKGWTTYTKRNEP